MVCAPSRFGDLWWCVRAPVAHHQVTATNKSQLCDVPRLTASIPLLNG